MRAHDARTPGYQQPALLPQARQLAAYIQTLGQQQIANSMVLSPAKVTKTHALWQAWSDKPNLQLPAIDAFLGDIYSGLQVATFTRADRQYANRHLYILSGLYGVLRALDSITPYRLEMGYRLPDKTYQNLYAFWGDSIAKQLPANGTILNLSAVEYTKAILPYLPDSLVITPKFMTVGKDGQPTFVVVHAKIARGAFARWLIQERIKDSTELQRFDGLGYRYDPALSTSSQPVFVCKQFTGLGLSVRLT